MAGSSSTVATLVLALQARNETRTAFEAVQRDLQQQTEAARRAAAEQTLAVRQATQQQLLEIRQRTAAEALALRQSVAGQALAVRQAMEQRIQMLRQDAEQTALLAREGARAQIEAITLVRDADIRAARERAMAATQLLRSQEEAARIAAASESASAREARGGLGGVMGRVPGGGLLESMGRFGAQMVLWNVGYAAINRVTEAVGGLASGLVTANAFMENFHQTMAAIYHSDTAATQASAWLTQFALKSPDTREHVFSAAEELAPLGVNLKEVMPAIGNVSAIMNVDETRGAQAFADAFEGRFVMMQQTLHITKGELVKFGMEIDHNGHVLNNSFVPAFERLAKARYGEGMAKQMQTVSGVFSNVHDAIENLQRIMGAPMFGLIRKDLQDFMNLLMSPQAMGAAHMFGVGLGDAFHAMSNAVRAAGPIVLGAIGFIVGAWNAAAPAIGHAIGFINGVVQRIGAFLHDTVLPVIFQGLAAASGWWQHHAAQVRAVAQTIWTIMQFLWSSLGSSMKAAFDILHGVWTIGWGLISGVFGLILAAMSGNWKQFGNDLDNMARSIAIGILGIFGGMVDGLIHLFTQIPKAMQKVMENPAIKGFMSVTMPGINLDVALGKAIGDKGGKALQHKVDVWVRGQQHEIAGKANMFTGAPSTYGTDTTQTTTGKDIFKGWMDKLKALQASGLKLPGLDWGKGGMPGGTGVDWTGGGEGEPFDPRSASSAQQKAIADAQTRFQLDMARGGITQAQGMRDINAILAADKAGGATKDQLLLTALQDTKTLDEQLLGQAQKQFDFDSGVAHPNRQKLHQDEVAYLKILAQTPGVGALDVATARRDWDKRIDQATGGHAAAAKTVAAYKQAGFDLSKGAGYGQTTVTMGPLRDDLVAHLRQQIRELQAQLAILRKIEHNTAGTHDATHRTAQHVTRPQPRGGAHAFVQRTGTPLPI